MFGWLRKTPKQATINGERALTVPPGQNLLQAALEAGLDWPHDCRVGSCGTCRCRLARGKIKALADFSYVLTPEQLDAGTILACQTQLKGDIEVEVELGAGESAAPETCGGVIKHVRALTHDLVELLVEADAAFPEGMLAGQYAEVSHAGIAKPRCYSFARAPAREDARIARFYIRHVPGGEFTDWLFGGDREGERLTLSAPYGSFRLHPGGAAMICIAGGSGMSAVKAVLEHACDTQAERDAVFLFGARGRRDLYCADEMEDIRARWHPRHSFEYIEVLSDEPGDDWQGARGYVTTHLKTQFLDTGKLQAADCEAYMCGPPPMIDSGIALLTEAGLAEDRIFYDKFLDASTMPQGR